MKRLRKFWSWFRVGVGLRMAWGLSGMSDEEMRQHFKASLFSGEDY